MHMKEPGRTSISIREAPWRFGFVRLQGAADLVPLPLGTLGGPDDEWFATPVARASDEFDLQRAALASTCTNEACDGVIRHSE
jgi:hypothetical protein